MTPVIERIEPQLQLLAEHAPVFIAAPMAQLVIDLRNSAARPRVVLCSLCETVEAVTRFLALIAMADLATRHDGKLPEKVRNALAENIERPTFGVWAKALRVVVAASENGPEVAPELPASAKVLDTFLRSSSSKNRPLEYNLIELRNALAHGSSNASPVLAAKLLEVWLARFADIIDNLAWLGDVSLCAFEPPAAWFTLQGASPDGVPAAALPCVAPFADPDAAVLQRGDAVLSLRPFGRRAPASRNPIPQIYARRGSVSLAFSLIGDEKMLQDEGPEDLITTFETLFDLGAYRAILREKVFTDLGFDTEARKDAEDFVGRSDEVDTLWGHLIASTEGVLSVTGVAGVGKSALMGKLADDARKEANDRRGRGERWFVFLHRFNADDGRCAPLPFLRGLYERLAAALDVSPNRDLNELSRILDAVTSLLGSHSLDRVVIFLDGLDELARREAKFVERSLPKLIKAARKTLCVASYRPEAGLPEIMQSLGSAPALSTGALQPFNESECRTFIAEHLSDAVRSLIEHDEAADGGVRNRFVEELVKRSGGLPKYLVLVRKDIASGHYGKLSAPDAERLPRNVEAYFQELLERYGVGDVARVRPLVTAYLAEAKEPLTIGELEALVARADRRGRRPRKGIVATALANLGGVLRSTFSGTGQRAYELFHVDFRDFVRCSPTIADARDDVRDLLLDGSRKPGEDEASRYFYRWGIEHLVEVNLTADALSLLSNLEYQILRLAMLTHEGGDGLLRAAWSFVASKLEDPMAMPDDAFAWRQFWATEGALFEPGEGRDAALELIERALEYAPDTVVGRAATPYIP